jgi:hypothetical protein
MSVGRRLLATLGLVIAALVAVVTVQFPGAEGAYLAKITNSADTAATNPYFTCTAAVSNTTAGAAYFAYPFAETTAAGALLTGAADVSGNNNTGIYSTSGITYNVANTTVCPRDKKPVITFDGSSGYAAGPNTTVNNPNVFSLEVWFQTSSAQGKLIGFGSSRTGSSGQYDRHLYIDSTGKLEFGVYPGSVQTIATPAAVTDGKWHYAVATLSTAGMLLYLDGKLVNSLSTVTTGENHTGYWRIGYDNIGSWTNTPTSYYFKGSMAWAAVYTYALTASQVAQHYAAGS